LRIGELLLEARVISSEQLDAALAVKAQGDKRKIGQILIEMGSVNETQLTQTLSQQLSVPWVSLHHIDFSRQLLNQVPRDLAERYCLVPIYVRKVRKLGDTLYVAMDDPTNEGALAEVEKAASLPVRPMIACASDIRSAIRVYYPVEYPVDGVEPPPPVPEAAAVAAAAIGSLDPAAKPSHRSKPAKPVRPKASGAPRDEPAVAVVPAPQVVEHPKPVPVAVAAPAATLPDNPPAVPASKEADAREGANARRGPRSGPKVGPRMIAMTLLDGTTLQLPARRLGGAQSDVAEEGAQGDLTARDLVSALRAVAHGQDATEILGEKVPIEAICAALLSLLLRKGLVADWEFVDELRKV
jgi:type IV pilus assembly protein PilB